MHPLKSLLTLILALTCSWSIAQQSLQNKADELFGKFAYAKAIPLYEKMVVEDFNQTYALQRLAECYLLQRDFEKALPYFKRFIEEPDTPSTFYFKYAMALKSSGNQKEALKWLKKYKKLHKNDPRVKQFLKDGNLASVVFNSNERYTVEPVNFNSKYSDFGGFMHDGKFYFSSARTDEGAGELK